jgi:hypothetical protein
MTERIDNFIACAVHCGYGGRDSLTRKEVYSICETTGIVYPRWLAKNPDRRICRGGYDFPELKAAGVTQISTDDMDPTITVSDDMVDVNDATVVHSDVLTHNATVTIL